MPFYRARFSGTVAGTADDATANIPRSLEILSVRCSGTDSTGAAIDTATVSAHVVVDGSVLLTDKEQAARNFCGDGRERVPLDEPVPVSNNITVHITNRGANDLGVVDFSFECAELRR